MADNNDLDYRWSDFAPQPAPDSVRPFPAPKAHSPASDDDLDRDYFADEENDFYEDLRAKERKSIKLMAVMLIGAVLTGGSLGVLYKSLQGGRQPDAPAIRLDLPHIERK